MLRVSNEKLFSILIGLPSIYLYFSGLGQFIPFFSLCKTVIYPFAFMIGLYSYKRTISKIRNFGFIFIATCVILLSVMLAPDIAQYLWDTSSISSIILSDVVMLYLIAFPAFFLARQFSDSDELLLELYIVGKMIVLFFSITFFLVVFIYRINFDYMNISYGVIPWLFFVIGYAFYKKNKVSFLISVVSVFFIFVSGCRGAAMTTMIFVVLLYLASLKENFTVNRFFILISILLVCGIAIINLEKIVSFLYELLKSFGFNSRTLELYLGLGYENGLNHYSDRGGLQITLLENLNLFGHGIYGDRLTLSGVYAHNVLLEWLYDFGIIVGGSVCVLFVVCLLKNIKMVFITEKKSEQIIISSCVAIMTCKYMVSSSYLHSAEFWALTGILLYYKYMLKTKIDRQRARGDKYE